MNTRVTAVVGHYGSGKTEFSVSLAMHLAANGRRGYPRMALADLDIANPYFRSRERRELLEGAGVAVYADGYRSGITAELPALDAAIRAPLEDPGCLTIVDAGGNDAGALVLNQFSAYFPKGDTSVLCVVNANRPETSTQEGAAEHMAAIERVTGLKINGIVNNCHLLRETTAETVRKGRRFCLELSKACGVPLAYTCYPESLVDPESIGEHSEPLMAMGLYMRLSWLDINL